MHKLKTKKGSGSSRSKRKFSVLTDSWECFHHGSPANSTELKEFFEYNRKTSGIDTKGFEATCQRYKARDVSPRYANLFINPVIFHVEVRFGDRHISDHDRESIFGENLEFDLNEKPLEVCDYPLPYEEGEDIRNSYLATNELWNEFCDEEKHPKLHILVTIHPKYFSKIHETVANDLKSLMDTFVSDYDLDVKVNRITNRARLACEILGRHQGRFFRHLN